MDDPNHGLSHQGIVFPQELRIHLADLTQGDARMTLNYIEVLADLALGAEENNKTITLALIAEVAGEKVARFDNQGDLWYDLISAFHKSVRGSSPDAALYWYARIVQAGEIPCMSLDVC